MIHVSELIQAYLENRLDATGRAQVDSHLGGCSACRAEMAAARELMVALAQAGELIQKMPVYTNGSWAAVRERWRAPLSNGNQRESRRVRQWQVSVSVAMAAMALVSSMSLNAASAASPAIPSIQTPGTQAGLTSDTPTLAVTHPAALPQTPTLTLTPDQ